MKKFNEKFKSLFSIKGNNKISYLLVVGLFIIIELLMNTIGISNLMKSLLVPVTCYIIAAVALNLCVGFSGELSLGHAGFMSIGAYTAICVSGLLSTVITNPILRLIIATIVAIIVTAIFGLIISIPVLKLEGDYLAIVTLAFGQIIKSIIGNIYFGYDETGLHFSFINDTLNMSESGKYLISGPTGATGIERISTFTVAIIVLLLSLIVIYHLINSKNGRAILASRDNRIASLSVGIDVTKTKTLAFVISVVIAGAAGAIYGLNYSSVSPAKFDFNQSILILVYVVLGGLGNINGTIVSTIVLYLLPELFRSLQDYRMIVYALILITIMLVTNNDKFKTYKERLIKKKWAKK